MLTAKTNNEWKAFLVLTAGEHLVWDTQLCTVPCSVFFPFSQLTSVNNFQLVPVDSPAALSPLVLMLETDESHEECEKAGAELLQMPTQQLRCSRWSPVSYWHPESLEVYWGYTGLLSIHPEHSQMDRFTVCSMVDHLPLPSLITLPLWDLSSTYWLQ